MKNRIDIRVGAAKFTPWNWYLRISMCRAKKRVFSAPIVTVHSMDKRDTETSSFEVDDVVLLEVVLMSVVDCRCSIITGGQWIVL